MDERAQNVAHGDGGQDVASVATQWLTWLFGERPPGLIWIGGHGNWTGCTFETPAAAAEYAAKMDAAQAGTEGGVYFRLTPMRPAARGDRGGAEHSTHLVAFGADLDLTGPGHKPAKLPRPETEEQLREILAAAGVPEPSAWVHSGGGRYAFWKLAEPIELSAEDGGGAVSLGTVQQRSATLHARIIAAAAARGWKIDNTRDLARVYRLPGTHNRKGVTGGGQGHRVRVEGGGAAGCALHALTAFPSTAPAPSDTPVSAAQGDRTPSDTSGVSDPAAPRSQSRSQLFSGKDEGARPRRLSVGYTLADAMTFVGAALDRLRAARDGEINNRLNDAAMAMAHFGPEFWDRAAAERQLYAALDATVYDGATWQAADTIRSAYDAMAARGAAGDEECWAARLNVEWTAAPTEPAPVAPDADEVSALLAEMLGPDEIAACPPPRYMIKGLLQFDSESWIIGAPGSKKSFVALDMAGHVARGMPWQGRKVNPARVVFIVAEGAGGTTLRMQAWQQRYGAMGVKPDVSFLPRPVQARGRDKGQVAQEWAVLVAACKRLAGTAPEGYGMLVVIDTQARVTLGLNENDADDMGLYVRAAGMIREATGACVLTVHHTGRKGGDARGSSAIDGAQTTELKVEKAGSGAGDLYGRVVTEKQKDIVEADPIKIKFASIDLGQDADGQAVNSLVVLPYDAWDHAEFGQDSLAALDKEAARKVTPFAVRSEPEHWTYRLTDQRATLQRWLLQALADTAGDRGLTQAEWRGVVEEKLGKQTATSWRRAFQAVVDSCGQAVAGGQGVSGVVVKVHGADRWTVDPVAVVALGQRDGGSGSSD